MGGGGGLQEVYGVTHFPPMHCALPPGPQGLDDASGAGPLQDDAPPVPPADEPPLATLEDPAPPMVSSTSVLPPQATPSATGAATLRRKGVLKWAMRERRLMMPPMSNSHASPRRGENGGDLAVPVANSSGLGTRWHKRDGAG